MKTKMKRYPSKHFPNTWAIEPWPCSSASNGSVKKTKGENDRKQSICIQPVVLVRFQIRIFKFGNSKFINDSLSSTHIIFSGLTIYAYNSLFYIEILIQKNLYVAEIDYYFDSLLYKENSNQHAKELPSKPCESVYDVTRIENR